MSADATVPIGCRGRILLVEDNEATGRGLTRLLESHGFEVTAVRDGASALRALDSGPPPDVVLTDLQLPDLDGREVARYSRRLAPPPRVVLVTGWDLDVSREESALWGIDEVLTKPVDVRALVAALGR